MRKIVVDILCVHFLFPECNAVVGSDGEVDSIFLSRDQSFVIHDFAYASAVTRDRSGGKDFL